MTRPISIIILLLLGLQILGSGTRLPGIDTRLNPSWSDCLTELYSDTLSDSEPVLREIQLLMPEALAMPGAMEFPWSRLNLNRGNIL